jgi:hypothetical protein
LERLQLTLRLDMGLAMLRDDFIHDAVGYTCLARKSLVARSAWGLPSWLPSVI